MTSQAECERCRFRAWSSVDRATESGGWFYAVHCSMTGRNARGFGDVREAAEAEARFWMQRLCPNHGRDLPELPPRPSDMGRPLGSTAPR